jgi:hypothetical protein
VLFGGHYSNNDYANAPRCYITGKLPVFFKFMISNGFITMMVIILFFLLDVILTCHFLGEKSETPLSEKKSYIKLGLYKFSLTVTSLLQ